MLRRCSNCQELADFSIGTIISSIDFSPRLQQSSKTVRFCQECLSELCNSEHIGSSDLSKAVNAALTKLQLRLKDTGAKKQ